MKKLFIVLIVGLSIGGVLEKNPNLFEPHAQSVADDRIANAYQNRLSGTQVGGSGVVIRILPDDTEGSRHQKFILKLPSGQTLLMAHNIDLAPRIDALREGDTVDFYGEYAWNAKGGIVHWTHRDPGGRHESGGLNTRVLYIGNRCRCATRCAGRLVWEENE